MAYDRGRLDALRIAMTAALDELSRMRSDDVAAAGALRRVGEARRLIGDRCLPRIRDLLDADPLSAGGASWLNSCPFRQSVYSQLVRLHHWELGVDPLDDPVPASVVEAAPEPWTRTFDDVTTAIRCGELVPLIMPMDAHHPEQNQITTVEIAPGTTTLIGNRDVTSNWLKTLDYASDVSWVGWREHHELSVYYLSDVVVTATIWVVDPKTHEVLRSEKSQTTTSGFIAVRDKERTIEANPPGGGDVSSDPNASPSIPLDHEHVYSGTFYPDTAPRFEPLPPDATTSTPTWKFMSKRLPLTEAWGTWGT